MVLTGARVLARKIITNIRHVETQVQPCGIDLSLKLVSTFDSAETIDFDNSNRKSASTKPVSFIREETDKGKLGQQLLVRLPPGSYLVEFNEKIDMPLNVMGQLLPRSSLFRSGAWLVAGVMDSGYRGVIGAMLKVDNPAGICLHEHARIAQMVFHEMSETAKGYDGQYQDRTAM